MKVYKLRRSAELVDSEELQPRYLFITHPDATRPLAGYNKTYSQEASMIDEQTPQTSSPSNRKWIALAVGGGCALAACLGLVVALAVTVLMPKLGGSISRFLPVVTATAGPNETSGNSPAGSGAQLRQNANTLGDPDAPVKMVEYADFQCPYCLHYWQETEPQIIKTYVETGKVYYEYRSVGAFIGPESAAAAEAVYCAGDQGKFWEYHDALFSHWTGENVGDFANDKLREYATSVGLEATSFDSCLGGQKYADRVQQDAANAKSDGIHATPSFLINGKLIEGAEPFDVFQQAIEDALQGK